MNPRYSSHIRLPELGAEGQRKLKDTTVLIVGCGALGSPCAMTLAGSGVGHIIIADFDTVEVSNLQRQPFFTTDEAGQGKVALLKKRMEALNPEIEVTAIGKFVNPAILSGLTQKPDMVVDAADNPATTYMLEKYCSENSIPLSTAGISGWEGQIFTWLPGNPRFSEIIPVPDPDSGILPCSIAGVFSPLAGIMGALQASEVIKISADIRPSFANCLLKVNLLDCTFEKFQLDM